LLTAVKYGLIIDNKLSTSIVAIGQIGVWRLVQYETISSDGSILEQIAEGAEPFLPEQHDFIVIEIYKSKFIGVGAMLYLLHYSHFYRKLCSYILES
jgi:hypothetical protein